MPFIFKRLDIKDIILIEPNVHHDKRGFFLESYNKTDFISNGINIDFIQDNHSNSKKGVLRGLHYQRKPNPQAKLVRCIRGEILDVAVDIRKNSDSFGRYVSQILSDENKKMMYIPDGFAHGFLVLSNLAEVVYKVSGEYSVQDSLGIRWDDPDINIDWQKYLDAPYILSEKDEMQPYLKHVALEDLY